MSFMLRWVGMHNQTPFRHRERNLQATVVFRSLFSTRFPLLEVMLRLILFNSSIQVQAHQSITGTVPDFSESSQRARLSSFPDESLDKAYATIVSGMKSRNTLLTVSDLPMGTSSEIWQFGGRTLRVTHLEKLYWPQAGFTKGQMLQYYQQIAPVVLPYFKNRPVTLRLFPEGAIGPSYYMRDYPVHAPSWLQSVQYQPRTLAHAIRLPLIDDSAGLLWFANEGAIEFHLWSSHTPDLTVPDQAIFDLDPGEGTTFSNVRETALRLHDALEHLGIRSYVKTSGRHGLHVHVALVAGYTFEQVRSWVKGIGQQLAARYPDVISIARGSTHQGKMVTIDAAQNSLGRNTAAAYTLRASATSPTVSTPLSWEELESSSILPTDLTPQVVLQRIQRLGDLFSPVLQADQRLA